jgi:hypothetical protein
MRQYVEVGAEDIEVRSTTLPTRASVFWKGLLSFLGRCAQYTALQADMLGSQLL